MPPDRYAEMVLAIGAIEYRLEFWISRGGSDVLTGPQGKDPVVLIHRALRQCPDEYPPRSTAGLEFISDPDLRESMRRDVGAATRAFENAEWKAVTVLGGAAIEALLHWKLGQPPITPAQLRAAGSAVVSKGKLDKPPKDKIDNWGLQDFIEIAGQLEIIRAETVSAANLARNFRNLIYPGAAKRRAEKCDRATALSALAGLEHVIRDLSS